MGRMVTEVAAIREAYLGPGALASGSSVGAAIPHGSVRRLPVPLLASLVVAEGLAFGLLATSGNIPHLVLKAFRVLLTL